MSSDSDAFHRAASALLQGSATFSSTPQHPGGVLPNTRPVLGAVGPRAVGVAAARVRSTEHSASQRLYALVAAVNGCAPARRTSDDCDKDASSFDAALERALRAIEGVAAKPLPPPVALGAVSVKQRLHHRRAHSFVSSFVLGITTASSIEDLHRGNSSFDDANGVEEEEECVLKIVRRDLGQGVLLPESVRVELHRLQHLGSRYMELVNAVYDCSSGTVVIAQRLEGTPVQNWVPRQERSVMTLVRDVCRALRYCGSHGIRHQHLNATNIFATTDDSASSGPLEQRVAVAEGSGSACSSLHFVVSGFGFATLFDTKTASNTWEMGYRHVAMFPPELVLAERQGISRTELSAEAMDLWALGCIAYEALFRCHMYENDRTDSVLLSKEDLFDIIASSDPVPFPWSSGIASSVGRLDGVADRYVPPNPEIVSVVKKLLSKEPAQRGTLDAWLKQFGRRSNSLSGSPGLPSPCAEPSFATPRQRSQDAATSFAHRISATSSTYNPIASVTSPTAMLASATSSDPATYTVLLTSSSPAGGDGFGTARKRLSLGTSIILESSTTILVSPAGDQPISPGARTPHQREDKASLHSTVSFSSAIGATPFACAVCQREAEPVMMICRDCLRASPSPAAHALCRNCYDNVGGGGHPQDHVFVLHVVDDVMIPVLSQPTTPSRLSQHTTTVDTAPMTTSVSSFYSQCGGGGSVSRRRRSSLGVPLPPRQTATLYKQSSGSRSARKGANATPMDDEHVLDSLADEIGALAAVHGFAATVPTSATVTGVASHRRIIPAEVLSAREQSILDMSGSLYQSCSATGLLDSERRQLSKAPRRVSATPAVLSHHPVKPTVPPSSTASPRRALDGSLLTTSITSTWNHSQTFGATVTPHDALDLGESDSSPSNVVSKVTPKSNVEDVFPEKVVGTLSVLEERPLTAAELVDECSEQRLSALLLNDLAIDVFPLSMLHPEPLAHITILDLANNCMTVVPEDIEYLVNLRQLLLGNNKLTALPESIGNLTDLEHLDVNHNQLSSLPQSLMFCDQMEVLALDYNAFTEFPLVVFDLPVLKTLYLLENMIDEWPSADILAAVVSPLSIGIDNRPRLTRDLAKAKQSSNGNITVVWNKRFPDPVVPQIFVGSLRSAQSADVYAQLGITHVLTMGRGLDALPPPGGHHKIVVVDDLPGASIDFAFEDAVAFIDDAVTAGGGVLVHCFAGMSRSATTVIAYLMMRRGMRLDDAYNISKRGRPAIYPNAGFFDQLLALDAKLFPGQRPLDILSMERDKVP